MEESKPVSTHMITGCKLIKNDESLEVDHTMYISMIGNLLYVIATRPYVMQGVVLVAVFQSTPKETHVTLVKIILRYLNPRGKDFTLKIFTNVDWEGSVDD